MILPASPFHGERIQGLMEWLRTTVSSIATGWTIEHTPEGSHDWHETFVGYNAGYYFAPTSTWTVESEDRIEHWYGILGYQMTMTFELRNTDVGSSNAYLCVSLPLGYSVKWLSTGTHSYKDAGAAWDYGQVYAVAGERFVRLYTRPATNWTSTTSDNTSVIGSILVYVTKD